jgi:hypothetical protein
VIDATEVERALIGKLAADATLAALLTDGVYYDIAPIGSTRFAIVSLSTSRGLDEINDGETFRALIYVIKAVVLGSASTTVAGADKRIQELVDRQPLDLPPAAGAELMVARWVDRIRYTETIANDVWQHRGARYEITVTPI